MSIVTERSLVAVEQVEGRVVLHPAGGPRVHDRLNAVRSQCSAHLQSQSDGNQRNGHGLMIKRGA